MVDSSSASLDNRTHDAAGSLQAVSLAASFSVKDLDVSLAWYCDVVGFAAARRYERDGVLRAVALKAGAIELLIGKDDGAKGVDRAKGQGFSLQFSTGQNIDELAKGIKSRGGKLESDPVDTPWGGRMFRLLDPDGFKLVIASERSA